MRSRWLLALLAPALLAAPTALAHGTGGAHAGAQTGALPAWVLWAAGGVLVALSFALVGLFLTRQDIPRTVEHEPVQAGPITGIPRGAVTMARLVGLLFLALIIASALVPWNPGTGTPRLFWLGLWSVGAVAAYAIGNFWLMISPFRALAGIAETIRGRTRPVPYPDKLGAWPSTVLLLGLMWLEGLTLSASWLGRIAIVYTTFTLVGMVTFGAQTWLERAEVFDRVFAWWSTFAPAQFTHDGLEWGWPGRRLDKVRAADASEATFVVALVYAANGDGLLSTSLGVSLVDAFGFLGPRVSIALVLGLGFLVFWVLFSLCASMIRDLTDATQAPGSIAAKLASTLIPIAIGYQLAHNVGYIVDEFPLLIDALADPLNLNPGTRAAWLLLGPRPALSQVLQIGFVLVGHIGAVFLAHRRAFTLHPSKVQAINTEIPLTGAMVAYTLVSLWIITAGGGL